MRVAIIGADGFIGRHLTEHFAGAGNQIIAATRKPLRKCAPMISNIVAPFDTAKDFVTIVRDADVILYAATTSTPGTPKASTKLAEDLVPLMALLDALQTHPQTRLIFLSSGGTVYGNCHVPVRENSKLQPLSYHGAMKAASELFIQAMSAQTGLDATIFRPSNIYGPNQPRQPGFGLIAHALEKVATGSPLTIWGDGSVIRDYLFITDFCDLCYAAATQPQGRGVRIVNASYGKGTSIIEVLKTIEDVTGQTLTKRYEAARSVDVHSIIPDAKLACEIFNWTPTIDLKSGIKLSWDALQNS